MDGGRVAPIAQLDGFGSGAAPAAPGDPARGDVGTAHDNSTATEPVTARLDDVGVPRGSDQDVRIAELEATDRRGARVVDLVAPVRAPAPRAAEHPVGAARTRVADLAGARARPRRRKDGAVGAAAGREVSSGSRAEAAPARERGDGKGPDADQESVARAICLRLLTDRARTRQELAQVLRRKGISDEAARGVLERFDDVGLIDDEAFAEQWVRSRHAVRGLGRRALAVELRRKGVADDVAGEALAEIDAESEERRARELVARKLRSLRTDSDEQRTTAGRKLVGMLARKGYGGGIAYRVVREALADHGAELDELASEPPSDE